MSLLKPHIAIIRLCVPIYFTFHYVSIKTSGDHTYIPMLLPLHSTMSLLKLTPVRRPTRQVRPLHSTMSLLKLEQFKGVTYYCMSLHSTMSLLKRCVFTNNRRYCVPLHSTMSLLKRKLIDMKSISD